jgi:hypothetical protein
VEEQVEVQTKSFDRAAGERFHEMSGAPYRPPDNVGVSATIANESFKNAQDIAGPSIRRGLSAATEAATTPAAVRDAAALGVGLVDGLSKVPYWFSRFAQFSKVEKTFRIQVAKVIASWKGNHPLQFLLTSKDNLRRSLGARTIAYLEKHPELIEAGHVRSKFTGDGNPLVVMTAYVNQSLKRDVEGRGIGAFIDLEYALDIGGVLVEHKSANAWVKKGWLAQDVVDNATRVYFR